MPIEAALLTAFGLAVGSFLNVCIHRLPRTQSIVRPGSRCPRCRTPLRWHDNVPLLGYLLLRGRCRACGQPISVQYPAVEAVTAAVFVLHYLAIGWEPLLIPRLLFASAMIALFAIDLEYQLLPDAITLPGIVAGFAFSLVLPPGWLASLLGILIGGGVLFLVGEVYYRVRGEEGMGGGDVKMLAMIGAFLGWKLTLLTLVLASFLGSLAGAALIAARKGDLKYALPFGTFLAAAAIASALAGQPLIDWYLSFY
jgi:leader peptidase (prepilin peptidase)/N-methyltransferase